MGLPAAFALGAIGGLSKRFRTPSDKRAKRVLGGVVSAALDGNLVAIKVLAERRYNPPTGIASERAVWQSGYNQVASQRPDLIAAYEKAKPGLPKIDHSSPEAAAAAVTSGVGLYQPNALELAAQPIVDAATQVDAAGREALAQSAERVGLGGGAALAQQIRGTEGPLDKVIEFGKKPGGAIALAVGVLFAFFVIGRVLK